MKKICARCSSAISQKWKTFSGIFIAFSEYAQNFVHFEKKYELYNLNISEIIHSEKYGYLNVPESSYFRTPFESQCVHGHQALVKRPCQHFYQNFQLIRDTLSWKTSLLVRSEMLGQFGNTSSADHIYSRC